MNKKLHFNMLVVGALFFSAAAPSFAMLPDNVQKRPNQSVQKEKTVEASQNLTTKTKVVQVKAADVDVKAK